MIDLLRRAGTLGLGIGLLGVLLSALPPVLELEESAGLGWLFWARGSLEPPDDVVVVGISRESADHFGLDSELDEWPRALHADLIEQLSSAGAAVVAFDIIFDEHRSPEGDRRLAEAVRRAGNVILLERVDSDQVQIETGGARSGLYVESRRKPIEPLHHDALATAPFTLPVVPIRVSQFWTFGRAAGNTPNLPAAVLHAYALPLQRLFLDLLGEARPQLASRIEALAADPASSLQDVIRELRDAASRDERLGVDLRALVDRTTGLSARQRQLLRALVGLYGGPDSRFLNFYGPARTVTTIPYHRVAPRLEAGVAEAVTGKVVFVGFSESRQPEQQDAFFSVFSQRSGQNLSGVEIGATAFANLLDGSSIRPLRLPTQWLVVFLWGLAISAICIAAPTLAALPAALAAGAVYAAVAGHQFQTAFVWAPLVVPLAIQLPAALLSALLWNAQRVRRQRERVQSVLGYYLPPDVVRRLAHKSVSVHSNRELIFGTCLVTDAEQYTTLSEALHPEELGELMSAYYQVLVDAVTEHGGVVSDIAGDSLVAVWPAANEFGESHLQACLAATSVLDAVETFNATYVRRELPTRVGLDSGQLLLGNIGSKARGEYRAVGDIVNTAARLQGLNRYLGTRVLLSGAAAEGVTVLPTRPLGEFLLVGKQTAISVLELQAAGREPERAELNERFDRAMRLLRECRWTEAAQAFEAVLERYPDDGPSRFYVSQCMKLRDQYPAGGWDCVIRMTVK
ncbi:MAG: adenylate/guanylate cyclase domain-containing protein [Gammaproteobacteria bacterium]|nr:adenylate/guanylate cyclase domain-containing protein [Gammaproteobacteria bacterium]